VFGCLFVVRIHTTRYIWTSCQAIVVHDKLLLNHALVILGSIRFSCSRRPSVLNIWRPLYTTELNNSTDTVITLIVFNLRITHTTMSANPRHMYNNYNLKKNQHISLRRRQHNAGNYNNHPACSSRDSAKQAKVHMGNFSYRWIALTNNLCRYSSNWSIYQDHGHRRKPNSSDCVWLSNYYSPWLSQRWRIFSASGRLHGILCDIWKWLVQSVCYQLNTQVMDYA